MATAKTAKVLLVEGQRATPSAYVVALEKRGYTIAVERNSRSAVKRAQAVVPDVVILDAASFNTSGARICRQLRASLNGTPVVLIADKRHMPDLACGAAVLLVPPFTPRKLLNSVTRLLPGDDSSTLQVGPIKLNLAQRRVSCGGRVERVTPKQAKLLEMFLRAPGQLLTRKAILKHVWDTDYTGDTRTLDVHISWLRSIIEPNPQKPRYLKTLRAQGYRLDLPG